MSPLRAQSLSPSATGALRSAPLPPRIYAKSPVDLFRDLLAMSLAERKQALSNRPPEILRRIFAKLREYESLKPDDREQRLQATELRWYLLPLMSLSGTNRAAQLALVPPRERTLVEARLARWDMLPPPLQRDLLNSDTAAHYFTQPLQASNAAVRISARRQAQLEAGIDRWRSVSEEQRQKTLASFNQFFELAPDEREKSLNTMSDTERRQMTKTLAAYSRLSSGQRMQCIRSFEKFAGMSLAERQQFLKNAERWKLMTPEERAAWRNLVKVAPIMPPDLNNAPPLPHIIPHHVTVSVATN